MDAAADERNPEFPLTLDLRRPSRSSGDRAPHARSRQPLERAAATPRWARGGAARGLHASVIRDAATTARWNGFADYAPHDRRLRRDGRGARRAARRTGAALVQSLDALGAGRDRARAGETARRLIRENGVTYNVYGDPRGMDRPWQLDPIPLLVAAGEWTPPRGRPGAARAAART